MSQHQSNTAAVYFHPSSQQSICVGLLMLDNKKYVFKVFDPIHARMLLGLPKDKELKINSMVVISSIPSVLTVRNSEISEDLIKTIRSETLQGKRCATELEAMASFHQLLGRSRVRSFTMTPLCPSLANKDHIQLDFYLSVTHDVSRGFGYIHPDARTTLRKSKTLTIKENNTGSLERYMVVDSSNNLLGYLPPHIDAFCFSQYQGRRLPLIRINTVVDNETKPQLNYTVFEVVGDFLITCSEVKIHSGSKGTGVVGRPKKIEVTERALAAATDALAKKDERPLFEPKAVITSDKAIKVVTPVTPSAKKYNLTEDAAATKEKLLRQVALTALTCMNQQRVIGKSNTLPWRIPEDLKFFKQLTINQILIVGRKTFDSLPLKMDKRHFIVVTGRNPETVVARGISTTVVGTPDEAVKIAREMAVLQGKRDVYVIGGANIYEQLLPRCKNIVVTTCHNPVPDADAYFPPLTDQYIPQISPYLLCRNEHGPVEVMQYRNLNNVN